MKKIGFNVKRILVIALILTSGIARSQIVIDGNPGDWPSLLANSSYFSRFATDLVNNSGDDIFTGGGSKSGNDISSWKWKTHAATDKLDIEHAGVALLGTKIYFCADRYANNGDASLNFWLLGSNVSKVSGSDFTSAHNNGDVLIQVTFTTGGSYSSYAAFMWQGTGLVPISIDAAHLYARCNSVSVASPSGWGYVQKGVSGSGGNYPVNGFCEGMIDLSALTIPALGTCYQTLVIGTSASQTLTSNYEDLVLIPIPLLPSISVTNNSLSVCNGGSVTFNGLVTSGTGSGPYTYMWSSSSTCSSSSCVLATTLNYSPGTAITGTYTYYFTAKNSIGCASTPATATLIVNPLPVISAVAGNNTICKGATTGLTASGAGTGGNYRWAPSAGLSATTGASVIASPTVTTIYTITGTNSNNCSNTATVAVTVNPLPTITISGTAAICAGSSSTLTATGGVAYTWSPATGLSATTGTTVIANPAITTTYTLTGRNAQSCSNTATMIMTVNPLPNIILSVATNPICSGSYTVLTATGAGSGGSYFWLPATGLSATTGGNLAAAPSGTTTYTVTGINANSCSNRAIITLTVNNLPGISITPSMSICNGSSATLTAFGPNNFTWSPSTGLSATTGARVTANPTATTTYTVTGSNSPACNNSATVTVTVNDLPTIYTVTGGGSYCSGGSGAEVRLSSTETGVNYQLKANGLNTGTPIAGTGSAISFGLQVSTGTYTVIASNTATTCIANMTGSAVVNINPLPIAYTVTGGGSYCSGSTGVVIGLNGSTLGVNYQLQADGLNTGTPFAGTGSAISFGPQTTAGKYIVKATDATTGCSAEMRGNAKVIIDPMPNLTSIIVSPNPICVGSVLTMSATGELGDPTYIWSGPNSFSSTSATPSFTATTTAASGVYSLTATNKITGCTSTMAISPFVTVNPLPGVIAGNNTVTIPITLTDATLGGTWSSSNTSIAVVDPLNGIVTGVTSGTATITYTLNTGCYVTTAINVVTISGKRIVCGGDTTTLTYAISGGTWTSANSAVATIGSSSGVVTGISNGTSVISYTFGDITVTTTVTVDVPFVADITGPSGLCKDSIAGFSNATAGGVWSTGSRIAAINSAGLVSGLSIGYVNISYTFTDLNGCSTSVAKTINIAGHPSYLYTTSGDGSNTSLGDDGPAYLATIQSPRAMCSDTGGNVYICDVYVNKVRKININGIINTVAGNGATGDDGDGGPATLASLNMSGGGGVYVDREGNIYICNTTGMTIRKVTAATGIISTICGTAAKSGSSGDGGPAKAALIQGPLGICGDTTGNLYFADAGNNKIRMINTNGIISTIIGTGSGAYSGDGGPGISARLSVPRDLAMDKFGNLYIADYGNYVVRKYVLATGIITTFAGTGKPGNTGDGGPATAATLNTPARLAYDGANILYIADQFNFKVRSVNLTTGIIITSVANGISGFAGDGGPSIEGQLTQIGGLAFNNLGNIYISDISNKRIRVSPYNASIYITIASPTTVESGTTLTFIAHASMIDDITFQWQLDGTNISGATNSSYTVSIPGAGSYSYSCILTVSPECGEVFTSASNSIIITSYSRGDLPSGLINPQISEGIKVYPNPVRGTLEITGTGIADGEAKVNIIDPLGRTILSKIALVTDGKLQEQVDMQNLPAGMYLISVTDNSGKSRIFKCVKE